MLNFLTNIVHNINNSKLFAGLVMIMLNIGSKYITIKLSKSQEEYLRNSIARQLLIFSIVWMGTRDIILSSILTGSLSFLQIIFLTKKANIVLFQHISKIMHIF